MRNATKFAPLTEWGLWFHQLLESADSDLAVLDIADTNLRCGLGLPGGENVGRDACLKKVDDWTGIVDRFTTHTFPHFRRTPARFGNRESYFRVIALADCLQRQIGITYNFAFLEGDYDASDSRNLFLHGILSGFGGTCVTLPVLYCAIGRRLGYPLAVAHTKEHFFCRWDDDRETFCFDATSRGVPIRDDNYYRKWPKTVTPKEEQINGYIRPMTRREELAAFASARGHCLNDNFRLDPAFEAHYLAHLAAPNLCDYHDGWGLAFYSSQLWRNLMNVPKHHLDTPIEQLIGPAAKNLKGPDADFYREHAVKNIVRMIRNRRQRDRRASREAVFQQLVTVQYAM